MLRDTAVHQPPGHHRHTQYIVSSSEIYGYTQLQRTLVLRHFALPGQERHSRAIGLRNIHRGAQACATGGGASAMAVALNQDRASDVLRVAAKVYPSGLSGVEAGTHRRELELWSLRKERTTFARSSAESSCRAGVDAGPCAINKPAQQSRVVIHIDAGD